MAGLLDLLRLAQGGVDPNTNTQTPPIAPTTPQQPEGGLLAAYLEWMKRQQEEQQKGVEGTPPGMNAADAMKPATQVATAPLPATPAPAPQQKSGGGLLSLFKMFF